MAKIANELLRDDVLAELDQDPRVDSGDIGVAVKDGVVTLTGTVPTLAAKWAAEEAVKRVKGVAAVAQEIDVEIPSMHRRDDKDIARAIADALYWDTSVPSSVKAAVQDGYVTLSGEVDWNYQREEAETTTRRIAGVRGISNLLVLQKSVSPQKVQSELKRIFHRDAQLDADSVQIASEGGKVTLTGNVRSWYERNEASRAAWSVKGVTSVENRILVV